MGTLRSILFTSLLMLIANSSRAGMFAEHKYIGDNAYKCFIEMNHLEAFFRDELHYKQYGHGSLTVLPFQKRPLFHDYQQNLFTAWSGEDPIMYGDLTGLAGDHSVDFIQLLRGLMHDDACDFQGTPDGGKYAALLAQVKAALRSHHAGIDAGKNEGSFMSLDYALIAIEDQSHFLAPPQDLPRMLQALEGDLLATMMRWSQVDIVGDVPPEDVALVLRAQNMLLHLNNPAKYALFHMIAEQQMRFAAQDHVKGRMDRFRCSFTKGLFMNAFADHFLEDAFAAGHLPVQRGSGLNRSVENKGTHDYYCRNGLDVMDSKGDTWHTYGDNFYDSTTYAHAIAANTVSLQELWNWYTHYTDVYEKREHMTPEERRLAGPPREVMWYEAVDSTPGRYHLADSVLEHFRAYDLAPLPLGMSRYEEEIVLKRGSKNGPFHEIGTTHVIDPYAFAKNFEIHGDLGFGYCFKTPGPHSPRFIMRMSKRLESVIWVGGSIGYAYANYPDRYEHRPQLALHFTWLDRVAFDQVLGLLIGPDVHGTMGSSALGWEFKSVKHRTAFSIKYVLRYDPHHPLSQGITAALRLY